MKKFFFLLLILGAVGISSQVRATDIYCATCQIDEPWQSDYPEGCKSECPDKAAPTTDAGWTLFYTMGIPQHATVVFKDGSRLITTTRTGIDVRTIKKVTMVRSNGQSSKTYTGAELKQFKDTCLAGN